MVSDCEVPSRRSPLPACKGKEELPAFVLPLPRTCRKTWPARVFGVLTRSRDFRFAGSQDFEAGLLRDTIQHHADTGVLVAGFYWSGTRHFVSRSGDYWCRSYTRAGSPQLLAGGSGVSTNSRTRGHWLTCSRRRRCSDEVQSSPRQMSEMACLPQLKS